jgi:hypothetical protein
VELSVNMEPEGCLPNANTPTATECKHHTYLSPASNAAQFTPVRKLIVNDVILGWGRSSTVRLGRYVEQQQDGSCWATVELVAVKMLHLSWW